MKWNICHIHKYFNKN